MRPKRCHAPTHTITHTQSHTLKHNRTYLIVIGIHFALTAALHVLVPQAPKPDYTSPLFPYVPSASLLINAWLCSTLPGSAWIQYAIFLVIICVVYFAYSCASSLALQEHSGLAKAGAPGPDAVRVISASGDFLDARGLEEVSPEGERVASFTAGAGAARGGGDGVELQGKKASELV